MRSTTVSRALAAAGLILLVVGALLSATRAAAGSTTAVFYGLGAGLALVAAAPALRTLPRALRGRSARRGADALLSSLLFTAILVVLQATSVRRSHQFDLTRNDRHTLAPQTLSLLATLDRDVRMTAFFREGSAARDGAVQLLDLYARRNPRVRYRVVDPDRQPDLAHRLGAAPDEIVVESGPRRRVAWPPGEQSLTSAFIQVTRTAPGAVYFATGHGEKDIENTARDGYSAAGRDLGAQGYAARTLSLVAAREVPTDASVVVVAGPRHDFLDDEVEALIAYQRRGGSILFLLDPQVELPRVGALLAPYGLSVLDAFVLDERELRAGDRTFDATVVKVRRYERHPITRGFNYLTMFPSARPVFIAPDSTRVGVEARYLAVTDATSWGELDMQSFAVGQASRDGTDLAGPLPIAAAARRLPVTGGARSRVVLVGDSDFANNVFYGLLGNADWFLNIIAYLAEDEDLISIRPREGPGDRVYLTERQGRLVFAVCIVLMPLTGVVAGGVVLVRRRRL
jgi:ABC-type uncharacterized transport system involved in gliding motility auxiliary subunit